MAGTYRGGIVGLSKVSVDTAGAGRVDNATILLLEHVGPGSLGHLVGAAQVDIEDRVPQVVVHVGESLVTQDTSVVDQDINTTKGIDGGLDDILAILARCLVSNSLAAHLLDLLDNGLGVDEIVHNDGSAIFGKEQTVGTAKTMSTLEPIDSYHLSAVLHTRCHHQ